VLDDQALPTRREAIRVAKLLGCAGAHRTDDGWMPCGSGDELETLTEHGVRAYRRRYGKKSQPIRVKSTQDVADKYETLKVFDDFQSAIVKAFPGAKIGIDDDVTPKQRGGMMALLWMSEQDKRTAQLIGNIGTGTPASGIALSSSIRSPFSIIIGDGDNEEEGITEALHLWGHLAGLAVSYGDIDPAVLAAIQTWVTEGGEPPQIPTLKEMNALITSGLQDPNGVLQSFGIDQTEGRVEVALRAVAARLAVGMSLIVRTFSRSGQDEEALADAYAESMSDGKRSDNEEVELRMK